MISVSIQDLRPDSQEISAFYLEKIYLLQVNASIPEIPTTMSRFQNFSPPYDAAEVNALWFSSLLISLTTAVVAVSVQHWARQYTKITQSTHYIPHKRARVRAFVAGSFYIPSVIQILPAMMHLYVLLFIAGLLRYTSNMNRTVFIGVGTCAGLLPFVHLWIEATSSAWLGHSSSMMIFPFVEWGILWLVVSDILDSHGRRMSMKVTVLIMIFLGFGVSSMLYLCGKSRGFKKRAERASWQSSAIYTHILNLTLDGLGEDDAREIFFESIPGFYQSDVVKNLKRCLTKEVKLRIHLILVAFFRRALSSNTISGLAKFRRLAICITAADHTDPSARSKYNFAKIIHQHWHAMPQSVEFGEFLRSWDTQRNGRYSQWIISNIVAKKDERDGDRWMALAMDHLGISKHVLQDYLAHGDSILLAILIHSIRHAVRSNFSSFRLLPPLSEFDALNTLPGLQHEFCDLWNTLVRNSRDHEGPSSSMSILKAIRHIYVTLHQGTDAAPTSFPASTEDVDDVLNRPSSYPLCNIPDHLSDSTPPIRSASVGEVQHLPAAISTSPSGSGSLPASESHSGDSAPHPADESSESLGGRPVQVTPACNTSPHSPPAPVDPLTTTSIHTIPHHSPISASAIHDPHSTPDYDVVSISVAPRTPISPSVSLPDETIPADLQSQTTYITVVSQSGQLPVALEDHPLNLVPTTSPAVHQGLDTPILHSDIEPDITELVAINYSQDADTPSPAVATDHPPSITSDPGITTELLTHPLGVESSHNFDRPR